ncbi:MAG: Hpt domain-containing protein [Erysipelotrichaceae bacterium]|nr:Hpt domain-containing protein [Erysipelotrichaceae bacterium]
MLSIENLKEYGADVEEGLTRCYNNEEFYLKLVAMILDEPSFGALKKAIEDNDLTAAFEAAHGLKGVTANLALSPLRDPVIEITELLRSRTEMDYGPLMTRIDEAYKRLEELIRE